jgi:hypothetical protein
MIHTMFAEVGFKHLSGVCVDVHVGIERNCILPELYDPCGMSNLVQISYCNWLGFL